MKFSIAVAPGAPEGYPAIYKKDLYEGMQKAREYGYAGFEWHLRRPDFAEAENVQRLCDDLGICVNALGTGLGCVIDGFTLMHADFNVRMQAVERLKEFVHLGCMLESTVIIGSMKGKIPAGEDRGKYEGYLADNLKSLMELAEKKNVPVVLEVLNRYETNTLNTIEEMNAFVQRIGSMLLKTHIDTFHMNIEERDMAKSIQICKDTLGHVHFADSNRHYPGAGHIDFKRLMKALAGIGYRGYVAIECLPYPKPDTAAKSAINCLEKVIDGGST